MNKTSLGLNPSSFLGSATVRAPGVCGELVQGMLDDVYFLVTCPVDFFSRVKVELFHGGPGIEASSIVPKASAAVGKTLAHLGREELAARLTVSNPIPRGKGMGSSSADVAAAIAATGLALGQELSPDIVAKIALAVEPTDGIMFPGVALFDHREGRMVEQLGSPPPMEIVALDFGGIVDTLEFNRVDRRPQWQAIQAETCQALELVRAGIRQLDPELLGRGSMISALASQHILPKPMLPAVAEFAREVGAAGVDVGHSGTIIGVLLDARQRRGKATFHRARRAFPEAETIYHFRMLGGGLQRVADGPASSKG